MDQMEAVLGIDAGTTMVKSVLFDLEGNELEMRRERIPLEHPQSNLTEQDMGQIWNAVKSTTKKALRESGLKRENIVGIGTTGQTGSLLFIDCDGNPVKMISWLDNRAREYVNFLEEKGLDRELYDSVGYSPYSCYALVAFPYLVENQPEILEESRWYFKTMDWITFKLTGEVTTAESAMFGHINPRTRDYSDKMFELLNIQDYRHLFPPIVRPWEVAGELTQETADEIGLEKGTPVVTAGFDMSCAALGVGAIERGETISIIGTGGFNLVVDDGPSLDSQRKVQVSTHCTPDTWFKGSFSRMATPNLDWFIKEFCEPEKKEAESKEMSVYALCDEKIKDVPPGSDGVMFHPYRSGEIGPFVNPKARASFFGIGDQHGRYYLLRSIYEGIGYAIRDNFEELERMLKKDIDKITLTGGGSNSSAWCQIIADINNAKVIVSDTDEPASRGAAINTLVATDVYSNHKQAVDKIVGIGREYKPKGRNVKVYSDFFKVYKDLYNTVESVWGRLEKARDKSEGV